VLVLQSLCTLSDEQTEYQLKDRLSFMRFVGLAMHDPVPDAKTIWLDREQLARAGAAERLFARFDALLREKGWLAMGGRIIDATLIEARRPRLSQAEKDTLKGGGTPAHGRRRAAPRSIATGAGRSSADASAQRPQRQPQAPGRDRGAGVRLQEPRRHRSRVRLCAALPRHSYHAAAYDGGQIGAALDRDNTASAVWADTAYRSVANLALLDHRG
jgi:IS5 family transposase